MREPTLQLIAPNQALMVVAEFPHHRVTPLQHGKACIVLGDADLPACGETAVVADQLRQPSPEIQCRASQGNLRGMPVQAANAAGAGAGCEAAAVLSLKQSHRKARIRGGQRT